MNAPGLSIAQQTPDQALAALDSRREGLSAQQARQRLAEFGPTRVEAAARESRWIALLREFGHFFAIVLWLAAGLAFFAEHAEPGQGMAQRLFDLAHVRAARGRVDADVTVFKAAHDGPGDHAGDAVADGERLVIVGGADDFERLQ